ncbi:MAG: helix-turn-helix transcriptional regulator [Anaerolineaceae bacterium]|nr:helix-turn-helix transcriptional regulator [Anaerolineaceae bacterium]
MQPKASKIRAKKLGILIYDARLAARRSPGECASAIGVTQEKYADYESGGDSPSLPELEALAYFLDVPLDHFWGSQSLSEKQSPDHPIDIIRLLALRQRMIGALLRQARDNSNLTLAEVAQKSGIPEDQVKAFERGEQRIPIPELELLINCTGSHLDEFMDKNGPVGQWRADQQTTARFLELPTDLRDFVSKPVNRPYVELAFRLSELSVERLRAIAEGLLEITY